MTEVPLGWSASNFPVGTALDDTIRIVSEHRARAEAAAETAAVNAVAAAQPRIDKAMQTAAAGAAAGVAPAAADAIRAQVAADAERAATAAASIPQNAVQYVIQVDGTLPPAPPGRIVHWYCWTDPTPFMKPGHLWFKPEHDPTVPDMPADSSWSFVNARTGTTALLKIHSVPDEIPLISALEYRVNGGTWTAIPAVPGDHELTGFIDGSDATAEILYRNFLGAGVPTVARTIKVTSGAFRDDFNRPDQYLSADLRYVDVAVGGNGRKLAVRSNVAQGAGTNETYVVQINENFASDQYIEAQILGTGNNTTRGVMLYARMPQGKNSGYRLRMAGATWILSRIVDGVTSQLATGTHANVAPFTARLTAIGRTLTAYIGGAVVATVTDNDPAAFLSGTVGIAANASSQDGASSVRFDNLVAGNV